MKAMKFATLFLVSLVLAACATSKSGDVYTREQARREMSVRSGVVESVREVTMEGTHSGVGAIAGGAVGGIAGSHLGNGNGEIVGSIFGAVLGGLAGAAVEEGVTKKNAQEITVKLDNGQLVAVVQEAGELFNPGEKVRVLSDGGSTRVTH